ncbi:SDR family NAD(P)-dependent oxidoreductase [Paenibacillus senegalensis]|uniref:SDR family NAD(P)-dependent oxidoreductase n=1 Tax=Paenibacillus senegalensis TaxID=1465766 RepID=UPI00028880CD|nr:SDR family NAD(P)-dependent oxidoreductase [Paenibacillus senegalensis]
MRLKGKKGLITGAAQGIGAGIAERFAREGADLVLLDVLIEPLEQTAKHLQCEYGVKTLALGCDLADTEQTLAAAEDAWERFGPLDFVVNNAGIATREPFTRLTYETWRKVQQINVDAMFIISQAISKRMIEASLPGAFVQMASKNGLAGSSMLAHYNSSKGAVVLLTQSMACELAPYAIRVNAVAPGFIATPLDRELKLKEPGLQLTSRTPMGRMGRVEEVANACLFLVSEEASYITGAILPVDGGHLANASEI